MFKTPPPRKSPVPNTGITSRTASSNNLQENGWMCNCNPRVLAPERTAYTHQNLGRKFYTCAKGRGNSSCDFFIWVEEARVAEAVMGYSFSESKVRTLRGAETAVAVPTTPKYLQSLLSWPVSGRTRSGTCYTAIATAPVLSPTKALAPPPSSSPAKRRREWSPSDEVSEEKPNPRKSRRPNRVTKNPYCTDNRPRTPTPKPPTSSISSRKAPAVTTGAWDHRSIVPPPSETDADERGSDNDATVTPSLSPDPFPRRWLFGSNSRPTTPTRRVVDTRATPRTPGSRTGSFYSGVLSSPGRGVRFDVRVAVDEFVRAEGIDLKGAEDKLFDILEREVKQKEGVCKGREIARTAHRRATDVIAGLNRRIEELEKERDEARAANVESKIAIEELETRLNNADLESHRASSDWY